MLLTGFVNGRGTGGGTLGGLWTKVETICGWIPSLSALADGATSRTLCVFTAGSVGDVLMTAPVRARRLNRMRYSKVASPRCSESYSFRRGMHGSSTAVGYSCMEVPHRDPPQGMAQGLWLLL